MLLRILFLKWFYALCCFVAEDFRIWHLGQCHLTSDLSWESFLHSLIHTVCILASHSPQRQPLLMLESTVRKACCSCFTRTVCTLFRTLNTASCLKEALLLSVTLSQLPHPQLHCPQRFPNLAGNVSL